MLRWSPLWRGVLPRSALLLLDIVGVSVLCAGWPLGLENGQ